ncbi:MAG: redoxin family protein [Salinivirgaceae bacterium]|jgi:thiol-disulfide isomerase/thioredoxin|nr:redoxin family protein [Salinivirgaceae bacterium]
MRHLLTSFLLLFAINSLIADSNASSKSEKIHYVETVQSLGELFHRFEGKVIYVDFWAPWCSPCVKAMQKAGAMDEYFEKHDIVRLYISIEKNTDNEQKRADKVQNWELIINQNQVAGHHYYAELKTVLFDEIIDNFMRRKLSLPWYAIINKHGVIVDPNAPDMHKPEKLERKLSKYLNE